METVLKRYCNSVKQNTRFVHDLESVVIDIVGYYFLIPSENQLLFFFFNWLNTMYVDGS